MMTETDFGGPDNILSICFFSVLNTFPKDTNTILWLSEWIWEISWEKPMEPMQNGETEIQELIGLELLKYVLRRSLKSALIGSFS